VKILFASMPFDGHFNPLTGLAVHLQRGAHDVRFYTGPGFGPKLASLGIPHVPFKRARDVNPQNLAEVFPEAARLKGPKAIGFALKAIFFGNLEAHYRDLLELHAEFPFDIVVHEAAFYASRLVHEKLGVPLYTIWPAPTPAPRAEGLPPPFFGLSPPTNVLSRVKHAVIDKMIESTNREGAKILHDLRSREALPPFTGSIFDLYNDVSRKMLQIGVPGLDFPRPNAPRQFEFIGPLLPHRDKAQGALPHEEKFAKYPTVVVVSQGTIDNRDPDKLFVPALEALRGGPHLVVATTGGKNTEALRGRFPDENVIVEDYVDFGVLLEQADVFVCNGGYGSVLQALVKGVPLLSAGEREGKNDINARLEYAGVALNLKTERPSRAQIAAGVARVLGNPRYAEGARRIRDELLSYDPFAIFDRILADHPTTSAAGRRAS
jgi:UDP:flavonoid glycosyltransferase YjiC (YdhE family)